MLEDTFIGFKERGRGRAKETSMWERNINWLPPRDWTCNLSICPDQESNWRTFGAWDDAPTNRATLTRAWLGQIFMFFVPRCNFPPQVHSSGILIYFYYPPLKYTSGVSYPCGLPIYKALLSHTPSLHPCTLSSKILREVITFSESDMFMFCLSLRLLESSEYAIYFSIIVPITQQGLKQCQIYKGVSLKLFIC